MAANKVVKAIAKLFDTELELTEFERVLIRERFANPRETVTALAERYGLAKQSVDEHLKKPHVRHALARMHGDVIAQIQAMHLQGAKNYMKMLTKIPENDQQLYVLYQASRDVMQPIFNSPLALPVGKRELPNFIDGE